MAPVRTSGSKSRRFSLVIRCAGVVTESAVEGVILEPREIARRYVTSWFALDLVSSLPVDYIIVLVSPETGVTQLVHAGQ